VSQRSSRRRLRLRRKGKDGSSDSKRLIGPERRDAADPRYSARDAAEEVVFETGCCLFEAVLRAIALFALLSIPASLLLPRVT